MAAAACLYDGRTAVRHEVEVERAGDELLIRFADGGSNALPVGLLTFVMVPVQILLIVFVARGFAQAWNVEVEQPIDGEREEQREPQPA